MEYVTGIYMMTYYMVIGLVEKTSVKQDPKPQVCLNFQMSFLHLSQTDPPGRGI